MVEMSDVPEYDGAWGGRCPGGGCRARVRTWAGGVKVLCATTTPLGRAYGIIAFGLELSNFTGVESSALRQPHSDHLLLPILNAGTYVQLGDGPHGVRGGAPSTCQSRCEQQIENPATLGRWHGRGATFAQDWEEKSVSER